MVSPAAPPTRLKPSTSGLAIAGFVLAFLFAPIGLVLCAIALGQIGGSKGRLGGKGLAVAGLVISIIMTVISLLAAIAIPAFLDYMHTSKSSEARVELRGAEKAAKSMFIELGEFPTVDAPLTPATPCCANASHRCDEMEFDSSPAWQKLGFMPMGGHYQYEMHATPKHLEVTAVGDPTCSGDVATYKMILDAPDGYPVARYEPAR